ncbi:hypothetical protein RB653_000064 [Dictyostelium firmibasis]|uniref:NAD(P)-binding protein n=1 Tax=Dictyostelium firmibasis TaxID=79012 RepID=A0AAN7YU20_9MYCE
MEKKVIIFTGSTDGIGLLVMNHLVKENCEQYKFILPVRNLEKGEALHKELKVINEKVDITLMEMDLSSFESIRNFVKNFNQLNLPHLDILVNNAGVMLPSFQKTKDGFESTIGINHLGTSLLTLLLLKNFKKVSDGANNCEDQCNIVILSSEFHQREQLNFDKLLLTENDSSSFDTLREYSKSKLCNLLFSNELHNRLNLCKTTKNNIRVNSLHPGYLKTPINRDLSWFTRNIIAPIFFFGYGSKTEDTINGIVNLIENNSNHSGKYFSISKETSPSSFASNPENSKLLWEKTCELLSLNPELDL